MKKKQNLPNLLQQVRTCGKREISVLCALPLLLQNALIFRGWTEREVTSHFTELPGSKI